jgi:hypothetical protein
MGWFSAGPLTNPAIDTILADTGAAPANSATVNIVVASTVAAVAMIEKRNAANTVNVSSQVVPVTANGIVSVKLPDINWVDNERLRVRLTAAITGQIQCSILSSS